MAGASVLGCAGEPRGEKSMTQDREMRQAIVEFMRRPGYRPATARDLMRLLRLDRGRRHEMKRILRDLLNDGEAVKVGRDRYGLPGRAGRQTAGPATRGRHADGQDPTAR